MDVSQIAWEFVATDGLSQQKGQVFLKVKFNYDEYDIYTKCIYNMV